MKADFSRITFDPRNHYVALPLQQGRVLVDADWNEAAEIARHDNRVARRAIIGLTGGPLRGAALRIVLLDSGEPGIAAGTGDGPHLAETPYEDAYYYWVSGRALTQEAVYSYTDQPHCSPTLPTDEGYYLAWVDSFEHLLTALDRSEIREVALGGPDHGTRLQAIWQVRLSAFEYSGEGDPTCSDVPAGWSPAEPAHRVGRLAASVPATTETLDPCVLPDDSGYRRLENQLYRVEIRAAGDHTSATFVFSRDNGILRVRAVGALDVATTHAKLSVEDLGPEALTQLQAGQWVTISDEATALAGGTPPLCQIREISGNTLTFENVGESHPIDSAYFAALVNPTVQRWDTIDPDRHAPDAEYVNAAEYHVSLATEDWFELEDGVRIQFTPSEVFRSGDYWLIPARTHTGTVEFPDTPQLPHGVEHDYAALAILHLKGGVWRLVDDCRALFPALTELAELRYVGGDGQEAMPGELLPAKLEVSVSNGIYPVQGVAITFTVKVPEGTAEGSTTKREHGYLMHADATAADLNQGQFSLTVLTGADGLAAVRWVLGATYAPDGSTWSQHVDVAVDRTHSTDPDGQLHFHASQSVAKNVFVDLTPCDGTEDDDLADPTAQTVQSLLGTLNVDPADPSSQNLQHVLRQLLCRLDARHIPYEFPTNPSEVPPADVEEVKAALDALYWLVLQNGGDCGFAGVLKRMVELLSGKHGQELCDAMKAAPFIGECNLISYTLGSVVNVLRVIYIYGLALIDLGAGPGEGRGYEGLQLGDDTGINLEAFVLNEGAAWLTTYANERLEAIGDASFGAALGNIALAALERWADELGGPDFDLHAVLSTLASEYGAAGPSDGGTLESWNGPATRRYLIDHFWFPLFQTTLITDAVIGAIGDMLVAAIRILWELIVEWLLCDTFDAAAYPTPTGTWDDPELFEGVMRALERAFELHGLVRELPPGGYGMAIDVHMVAPGAHYPGGASWLITGFDAPSGAGEIYSAFRWTHLTHDTFAAAADAGDVPLRAFDDLSQNLPLRGPDAELRFNWLPSGNTSPPQVFYRGSNARRNSLHVLFQTTEVPGTGPQPAPAATLWLAGSEDLAMVGGTTTIELSASGTAQPLVGWTYSSNDALHGRSAVLAEGGPDDPAIVVSWFDSTEFPNNPRLTITTAFAANPSDLRSTSVPGPTLVAAGLPTKANHWMFAFTLDVDEGVEGKYLAVVLDRYDLYQGQQVGENRHVLLLLKNADGVQPWWLGGGLAIAGCWDLPMHVRVVGGGHRLVVLQFEPPGGETSWSFITSDQLESGELNGAVTPTWQDPSGQTSQGKYMNLNLSDWEEGRVHRTAHGQDGPWLALLGPDDDRVMFYNAWHEDGPRLERQLTRGATNEYPAGFGQVLSAIGSAFFGPSTTGITNLPTGSPLVGHDYVLQDADSTHRRLLTVLSSGDPTGTNYLEFHAVPRE